MEDWIRVFLIGSASNLGAGIVSIVSVPVVYLLSKSKHPDKQLSLLTMVGIVLAASFATGLSYHALVRFVFPNGMQSKAAALAFFPVSFLIAALLISLAWKMANSARDPQLLALMAFLVMWLMLGGAYMEWVMSHLLQIDVVFITVVVSPLIATVVYVLVKLGRNVIEG